MWIVGDDGKIVFIGAKVTINLEKFIEELAKNPQLANSSSEEVADNVMKGIQNFLRTISKEDIQAYFEVARGDHK